MYGRAFKELGAPPRRRALIPVFGASRLRFAKSLNYARIKREVLGAINKLDSVQRAMIPEGATLPEIMIAYALIQMGISFQAQNVYSGGRLRLGGAIVDFIVYLGSTRLVIRVQGDYWHSLPGRVQKDAVSLLRLRARRIRVFDAWEHDIYQAWIDGRLTQFVDEGMQSAA